MSAKRPAVAERHVTYSINADGRLRRATVEIIAACGNGHAFTRETARVRKNRGREVLVCAICERQRSRDHKRRLARAA